MSEILAKKKHKRGGVMFTQAQDRSVLGIHQKYLSTTLDESDKTK
jgi:hypothetical protein